MGLSDEQVDDWMRDGALHVSGIWPDLQLIDDVRNGGEAVFPSESSAVNNMVLHPRVLALAAQLLRVPVSCVRVHQAMVCTKTGRGESHDNQPVHQDYMNNSVLTPSRCQEVELDPEDVAMIVYLHDHETPCEICAGIGQIESGDYCSKRMCNSCRGTGKNAVDGGTCFVPGLSHTPTALGFGADHRGSPLRDDDPRYKKERRIAYTKGSALVYTIGTWHRGTPVNEGETRWVMFLSFRANFAEWVGGQPEVGHPTALSFAQLAESSSGFDLAAYLTDLTAEQRSVLGVPAVGDPYWTEEAIELARRRYGGTFVKPYLTR